MASSLAQADARTRALYRHVMGEGQEEVGTGTSAAYRPHHYLNFALNPDAAYLGQKQFNADYLVRRTEEVRPRSSVKWRAVALGGSTTFGEGIANETDTWPYQLEHRIRTRYGSDFDVINGGVGNYNVIDNMLHYLLLLELLEPDVVILYVGINDVHPRLFDDIKPDYSNSRLTWRSDLNVLPHANKKLVRVPFYRWYLLQVVAKGEFAHLNTYVQRPYPPVSTWRGALARNGTGIYKQHLSDLVQLLQAQGRTVILVPQVFIPRTDEELETSFAVGVAQHEDINKEVAQRFSAMYIETVGEKGTFQTDELLDNCHFNALGGLHMADLLFTQLEGAAVFSRFKKIEGN
ncbi:SGNH/GDSL hydrolase family protein [Nitrospira sp. Nam74]